MESIKKPYWYFRFTDSFLSNEQFRNMKHVPIYGYKFIVIYLELASISLEHGGIIRVDKQPGENMYPVELAKDIGEDTAEVGYALSYFKEKGLIEVVEADYQVQIHIPKIKNNIGKSSLKADQMRKSRKLKGDKIKGIENENKSIPQLEQGEMKYSYGEFKNVLLTKSEYENFTEKYKNAETIIKRLSIYKAQFGKEYDSDITTLYSFAVRDGIER